MESASNAGRSFLVLALWACVQVPAGGALAQSPKAGAANAKAAPGEAKVGPARTKTKAEPEKTRAKVGAERSPLEEAKRLLNQPEREKVQEGLRRMKEIGGPEIIAPVSERVRQGLPPTLVVLAVEALTKTGKQQAAPVLIELFGHRRAGIREAAVKALGELRVRRALPVLRKALDDSDAGVRVTAAGALGRIGDRRALPDLYRAFERGETGTLSAIADMAEPRDVNRLVGYLDQYPISTFQPVYLTLLKRKNFSMKGKLDLIARMGETESPDAEKLLRDLPKQLPKDGSPQLMRAIGESLKKNRAARLEFAKDMGKPDEDGPTSAPADKADGKPGAKVEEDGKEVVPKGKGETAKPKPGRAKAKPTGKEGE